MAHGDFVWCDLSSYHLNDALRFYQSLFGWLYHESKQIDGSSYFTAYRDGVLGAIFAHGCAGIYEPPSLFKSLNLPSFWMSYIEVEALDHGVEAARNLGAKIELEPMDAGGHMRVALVRDPLGAGFTMIEGRGLKPRRGKSHGEMIWNSLHVSRPDKVIEFYRAVFDWQIEALTDSDYHFSVKNKSGEIISEIWQIPQGEYDGLEYWAVYFGAKSLDVAAQKNLWALGAKGVNQGKHGGANMLTAFAPEGSYFGLIETR